MVDTWSTSERATSQSTALSAVAEHSDPQDLEVVERIELVAVERDGAFPAVDGFKCASGFGGDDATPLPNTATPMSWQSRGECQQ